MNVSVFLLVVSVLLPCAAAQVQPPPELWPVGPANLIANLTPGLAGQYPRPVDVNGDGLDDIVTLASNQRDLRVALGLGQHQFTSWIITTLVPQGFFASFCLGDFNGDGVQDVVFFSGAVTCCSPGGDLRFAQGLGNGMFGSSVSLNNSLSSPFTPANGELFGLFSAHILPGISDQLLVCRANIPNGTIDILSLNGGSLGFLGSTAFSLPGPVWAFLDTGDFNGDGVTDLVGDTWAPQPFGGLTTFFTFEGSPNPPYMTLGVTTAPAASQDEFFGLLGFNYTHDVNQDGYADIVMPFRVHIGSPSPLGLGPYIAVGLGGPVAPLTSWIFTPLTEPSTIDSELMVGDYDADSRVDVMTVTVQNCGTPCNDFVFYRGDGTGAFQRATSASVSAPPSSVSPVRLIDSDQDGDMEFMAVTSLGVFLSQNLTLTGGGFAPPGAVIPRTTVGFPTPGNSAFFLGIAGVPPQSACLLGLSTAQALPGGALPGLMLEVGPAHLLLPTPGGLGFLTADATGAASLTLPLPPDPALAGLVLYAQGFTLPGSPQGYAASATRRIVIW